MSHLPVPLREVLRFLVQRLQHTRITWAVTGSCSLALQELPVEVHDIDLRTTTRDAYRLEAIFQEYSKRPVRFSSTEHVRSHFGALDVHGIQVEIIGDMQHRRADGSWEAHVDMQQFIVWVELEGLHVPVMSLPFLYEAYKNLGRADKVALLQQRLVKTV